MSCCSDSLYERVKDLEKQNKILGAFVAQSLVGKWVDVPARWTTNSDKEEAFGGVCVEADGTTLVIEEKKSWSSYPKKVDIFDLL